MPDGNAKSHPKVFIGIPTGPPKLYSTYYMVASIANFDYPNVEVHWAVTGGRDKRFKDFRDRLTKLMEAVEWPEGWTWHIHYVSLTNKERNTFYVPILRNKTVLRDVFLDGDADYFLLLGGDNPPPRSAIKRLMKTKADVAMAVCYQRPDVDKMFGVYPLVWRYLWLPSDLDKLDVDSENLEELRLAWLHAPSILNVAFDPKWKKKETVWNVTGGDGCALIKREVLEMIDWGILPEISYHSEDIHFMSLAIWYGFTTCAVTNLHCPHMAPDGRIF